MKEIRLDWETYEDELMKAKDDGYVWALEDVIKIIDRTNIDDCFELFDVSAYEHKLLKKVIEKINALKERYA